MTFDEVSLTRGRLDIGFRRKINDRTTSHPNNSVRCALWSEASWDACHSK